VPPGQYTGVSLTIGVASLSSDSGEAELVVPAEPLFLRRPFSVERGGSHPLFLFLSPEFIVTDGYRFTPRFAMDGPRHVPRNFIGYVSNPYDNSVTVYSKRTMEVIQMIRTGVGPTGMALDQGNGLLYVATAGGDSIDVISSSTMAQVGRIRLHFGDEPTELALSPDGTKLLSANYGSSTVSLIDTRSLSERGRFAIDPDPLWVIGSRDNRRGYVLHGVSNSVSVIDLNGSGRAVSVAIGDSPLRGSLSRDDESLFIICQYSPDLLVFDVQSLTVTDRIFIGGGSVSLTVDPKSNLVYIGKKSGEVVVVDPAARSLIDGFPAERNVRFITIDGEENVLHVLSGISGSVDKFGLIGSRKRAQLNSGVRGHAVAVMGEL
jgi:DNA-binding beta-propeller fold protein YncE